MQIIQKISSKSLLVDVHFQLHVKVIESRYDAHTLHCRYLFRQPLRIRDIGIGVAATYVELNWYFFNLLNGDQGRFTRPIVVVVAPHGEAVLLKPFKLTQLTEVDK